MSNTGSGKKLASFNCEVQMWAEFITRCQEKGTTATSVLTELIKLYLDGSLDDLDVNTLDKRFNERVRATAVDYAHQMKYLGELPLSTCKRITVVQDQLNTHVGASLYKAFEPVEARRILDRLKFCYTSKHGSWLNQAEIELSILTRQCLQRRIPDKQTSIGCEALST